ncbi:MAG: alanine racemase, partial [Clostridia bacterium]|nr:alanine racemase [Clostridia bacterium]
MDEIISAGRSWIEIDLGAILRNLDVYSAALPEHMRVMAVVKADAYGHGDRVVAKKLFDHGVRHFAVSNIDEAIHIRNAGVGGQILILGYTPLNRAEDLARYDITQALLSEEYAERLSETGFRGKCQFALDTGMRRIGLNADDPAACERVIRAYAGKLNLDGLFT